jgi:hypothetical protein
VCRLCLAKFGTCKVVGDGRAGVGSPSRVVVPACQLGFKPWTLSGWTSFQVRWRSPTQPPTRNSQPSNVEHLLSRSLFLSNYLCQTVNARVYKLAQECQASGHQCDEFRQGMPHGFKTAACRQANSPSCGPSMLAEVISECLRRSPTGRWHSTMRPRRKLRRRGEEPMQER